MDIKGAARASDVTDQPSHVYNYFLSLGGPVFRLVPFLWLLVACSSPPLAAPTASSAVLELSISLSRETVQADPLTPLKPTLLFVEEDFVVSAFGAPTVSEALDTPQGLLEQGHLNLLQLPKIWTTERGAGAVVAVIDSGVDTEHAALKDAVLPGYDFVLGSATMRDDSGHGTAVAALIAGRGPQWGLAPAASILPLRILDEYNLGSPAHLAAAILYAADLLPDMRNPYPADVINLSLGGYGYSQAVHTAVRRAEATGVVVLAAAGNRAGALAFPANLPETLSVGAATLKQGQWVSSPYSNTGANLLAPVGGLSATNAQNYAESGVLSAAAGTGTGGLRVHGTSYAVAQASGLAALLVGGGSQQLRAELIYGSSQVTLEANMSTAVVNPQASLRALTGNPPGAVVVQVLDGNSLQEQARFTGGLSQRFELAPGHYRLVVWQDDGDGLRTSGEPAYSSNKAFRVYSGDENRLALELR